MHGLRGDRAWMKNNIFTLQKSLAVVPYMDSAHCVVADRNSNTAKTIYHIQYNVYSCMLALSVTYTLYS